jgi:hypothetical protein
MGVFKFCMQELPTAVSYKQGLHGPPEDGWQIFFWAIYFLNYVFTLSISCLAFGQN